MYVCIKRFGNEDYVEKYGAPQCIGMCATDYPRVIFGYLDKLYFTTKCDGCICVYDKISRLRVENPIRELLEVARMSINAC